MQTQRRLDDILDRDIGIQWFEGVALVQAVCEQVLAHGRADAFPSAADIAVEADGSVAVLGHSAGLPVVAAGHLLAGMAGDDVPVRLRLAINEATAAESPYPHLAAFSEALAYFERPGRRELIAAVYARAAAAPSRSIARPRQSPAPEVPKAQEQQARPRRRRRAGVGAGVARRWSRRGGWYLVRPGPSSDISGDISGAVRSRSRYAAGAESRADGGSSRAECPAAPSREKSQSPGAGREGDADPSEHLRRLAIAIQTRPPPIMVFDEVLVVTASEPGEATDVSGRDTRRVYSRDDGFVSAPRPVRPQLPPEPPFDQQWLRRRSSSS